MSSAESRHLKFSFVASFLAALSIVFVLWSCNKNVTPTEVLPPLTPAAADAGAGSVVILTRPRGYFGLPRDVVLFDGKEPADLKPGVPTDSTSTLRLPAGEVGRPVVTMFNQERIVAKAWPASENRIVMAELTY